MKRYKNFGVHISAIFGLLTLAHSAFGQSADFQERERFYSEARKYQSSVLAFTVVYDPKLMSVSSSTYYPPTEAAK